MHEFSGWNGVALSGWNGVERPITVTLDCSEFRLLGPVEIWVDGSRQEAGPRQRRLVLAALLADVGRPVPMETLVERVWGNQPPPGARAAVYAHVARIRRLLTDVSGADAGVLRSWGSAGYQLDIDPDLVDVHLFRRLVNEARATNNDSVRRLTMLREALSLWRAEPLATLPGEWTARFREGLRQQHLGAVLAWSQAEFETGRPASTIEPLSELRAAHPLSEPVAATLMRALAAAGRSSEALECYRGIRQALVDQLGLEPGVELQRIHRSVLRGELRPLGTEPAPPTTAYHWAVPALLPPDTRGFAGRDHELGQLDAMLSTAFAAEMTVPISVVSGAAGVGKTSLALRWAHRARARFPDGQLYVNLRGFDHSGAATAPGEAVRTFLDALGVDQRRVPSSLDAQVGLYRSLLADRRMLILLDNARDEEQVRPLLPGTSSSVVVATSRNRLAGLVAAEGAHSVALNPLTPVEAREMLTNRLGSARLTTEPRAVIDIIDRCARLPLALAVAAARAVTHPELSLTTLAEQLRAPGHLARADEGQHFRNGRDVRLDRGGGQVAGDGAQPEVTTRPHP
jgi:DNA-binding SARP family transcriptional activator